ncbi:LysM peptidoglycan-binding domain-containing protein, partial [Streptomyces sp. URMC 126]
HRGEPAPEAGTTPPGRSPGDAHTSRGTERGDTLAGDDRYTVRPGDNLSSIADRHSVAGGWPALYEANRATVGDDPDLIVPGQRLEVTGS